MKVQAVGTHHNIDLNAVVRERAAELERWSQIDKSAVKYLDRPLACKIVTVPSVLIYVLTAQNFSLDSALSGICLMANKKLHRLQLTAPVSRRLMVDYQAHGRDGTTRRSGEMEVLKVSIQGYPVEQQKDQGTLAFLGLKADLDLYLEASTRIPVQVSGTMSILGRVTYHLSDVWLAYD